MTVCILNKKTANRIFLALLGIEMAGSFLSQSVNETAARFMSLISFAALAVLMAGYVIPKELSDKKTYRDLIMDKELLVVIAAGAVALANLFIIGSNKGAFLTAADVLMALYLSDRLELDDTEKLWLTLNGVILIIWWFGNVKWYYNFNMVGMTYMMICLHTVIFLELLKKQWFSDRKVLFAFAQLMCYLACTLLCLLYHARCVLCGMILMGLLYAASVLFYKNRLLKGLLIAFSTAGSLLFTAAYILLGKLGISITILYKDVLSGRQDIWAELWEAFLKQPLTGIGSSYKIKSFFIFEVHNGLLDILVVHGVIVFAGVLYLLIRRLWMAMEYNENGSINEMNKISRIAFAGTFAILFTSFFENFFINSPYLMILMVLISMMKRSKL